MASRPDMFDIVDAAYRIDVPLEPWLIGLAEAALPHLDGGFGLSAFVYHRSEGEQPKILARHRVGIPEGLGAIYETVFNTLDPQIRERPFLLGPCITGSQLMGSPEALLQHPHMIRYAQRHGVFDSVWITAAEPSGNGCGFHAGRAEIASVSAIERERWERVAAHLASAVRLRRRLSLGEVRTDESAAIFAPDGQLRDATGAAAEDAARTALRVAVRELERARGPLRAADPDRALAAWRALVKGTWSLIEHWSADGQRYIVARENAPRVHGPSALTAREKQVLGFVRLGHHDKLIAYELGISPSTVRVLIARACAKLGVRTRDQLLRRLADVELGTKVN